MRYIGIDPGKDGALAVINDAQLTIYDTPTIGAKSGKREYDAVAMSHILHLLKVQPGTLFAALELTHSMPGQGVASMFSMGRGLGIWQGILAALSIPYEMVSPQRWRKAMLQGFSIGEDKKDLKRISVVQAGRLFPSASSQFTGPKGGLRDGRAEAALLAEYVRRQSGNVIAHSAA